MICLAQNEEEKMLARQQQEDPVVVAVPAPVEEGAAVEPANQALPTQNGRGDTLPLSSGILQVRWHLPLQPCSCMVYLMCAHPLLRGYAKPVASVASFAASAVASWYQNSNVIGPISRLGRYTNFYNVSAVSQPG